MDKLLDYDFLKDTFFDVRLAWRVMWDARVPLRIRAIPFLAMLYIVSPLDFVPGFVPIIGQIDDLAVLLISVNAVLKLAPSGVVEEHRAAMEMSG